MYTIYPKPKKQVSRQGELLFNKKTVFFKEFAENVFSELNRFAPWEIVDEEESILRFFVDSTIGEQGYEIEVTDQVIIVKASQEVGFFYAVQTLKQMFREKMECVFIADEPDLKVRGYMMDISRNKVPTEATVREVIDLMSILKMNHLELYVEGFSFEYKSFSKYLEEESYITVEEYQRLEAYANRHYIDLVPNQNGFGHMAEWLKQEEFKDLAEAPEGIFLWGSHRAPSTLDPSNPKSLELIKKMYADMIPYSSSTYFNMNFDEPFELGKGKSKDLVETKGLGNVYMDYTLKAYQEIKKYNKTPLIWGDVLIHHDDVLDRIPKDMIFVDWGYDSFYPFDRNLLTLKNANIRFMAAPGTSSWCSFLGRTTDALETVTNACIYTKMYGGEGILMTDWGDFGLLQFLPISLAPLAYAALLSYRVNCGTYRDLKHVVNRFVFQDKTNIIADLLLDLGNYNRFENAYAGNMTQVFQLFFWAIQSLKEKDPLAYFYPKMSDKILTVEKNQFMQAFFDQKLRELAAAGVDDLVKKELHHSISFVQTILKINLALNKQVDPAKRFTLLEEVKKAIAPLKEGLVYCWMKRNKKSGLNKSLVYLDKLHTFVLLLQGGIYEEKN